MFLDAASLGPAAQPADPEPVAVDWLDDAVRLELAESRTRSTEYGLASWYLQNATASALLGGLGTTHDTVVFDAQGLPTNTRDLPSIKHGQCFVLWPFVMRLLYDF